MREGRCSCTVTPEEVPDEPVGQASRYAQVRMLLQLSEGKIDNQSSVATTFCFCGKNSEQVMRKFRIENAMILQNTEHEDEWKSIAANSCPTSVESSEPGTWVSSARHILGSAANYRRLHPLLFAI